MTFDLGNLLCTWEQSLIELNGSVSKIIVHFENGRPDSANIRAKETLKAIEKMQDNIVWMKKHFCGAVHNHIEKKL